MEGVKRKATIFAATALLLGGFAATSAAQGLIGQCADCHTMHNSEQGAPVALQGTSDTPDGTANPNLLRMDCVACHASGGAMMIVELDGGSRIPQVYHTAETDLAAGNFRHITIGGDRKGHNVVDVVTADTTFDRPPGYKNHDAMGFAFDPAGFTCAGNLGCHGIRGQLIDAGDFDMGIPPTYRTGLAALSGFDGPTASNVSFFSGTHHSNYDGLKTDGGNPDYYDSPLAHSYRFIRGLKGYGNTVDRWQNLDAASHNEYAGGYAGGSILPTIDFGTVAQCAACHEGGGTSATNSRIRTPGNTMTGFCVSCHGTFHSAGVTNGSSGAFLRHPSDFALPQRGEYLNYVDYDITAPVARHQSEFVVGFAPSPTVKAGDLVMCLSCHVAHASPNDGMLRFDYDALTSQMRAGTFASMEDAQAAGGCLACHTTKGVSKQ